MVFDTKPLIPSEEQTYHQPPPHHKLQARNVQYDIVRIGNVKVKVDRHFLIFLKVSPWCWLVAGGGGM